MTNIVYQYSIGIKVGTRMNKMFGKCWKVFGAEANRRNVLVNIFTV